MILKIFTQYKLFSYILHVALCLLQTKPTTFCKTLKIFLRYFWRQQSLSENCFHGVISIKRFNKYKISNLPGGGYFIAPLCVCVCGEGAELPGHTLKGKLYIKLYFLVILVIFSYIISDYVSFKHKLITIIFETVRLFRISWYINPKQNCYSCGTNTNKSGKGNKTCRNF